MEIKSVAEQMFFSTMRIEAFNSGPNPFSSVGTGFYYAHKIDDNTIIPFIVTNKHVIRNTDNGIFHFMIGENSNPKLGSRVDTPIVEELWKNIWFGHPDDNIDVAIAPIGHILHLLENKLKCEFFIPYIDKTIIPSDEAIDTVDALEEVVFIGYPNGIWDEKNYLPIARKGSLATLLNVDFDGNPIFLIDASVFGGSSGSPVFIKNLGSFHDKKGTLYAGNRIYFLGILAASYYHDPIEVAKIDIAEIEKDKKEMIDIGIVYKARTILETVDAYLKQTGQE